MYGYKSSWCCYTRIFFASTAIGMRGRLFLWMLPVLLAMVAGMRAVLAARMMAVFIVLRYIMMMMPRVFLGGNCGASHKEGQRYDGEHFFHMGGFTFYSTNIGNLFGGRNVKLRVSLLQIYESKKNQPKGLE